MVEMVEDDKTGKLKVSIGCAGTADDEFEFEISTGLYEEELGELEIGRQVNMVGVLVKRESDPELDEEDR